jgi:hypothetical protein
VLATDAEPLRDEVISKGEDVVGNFVALLLLSVFIVYVCCVLFASSWSAFSPPSIRERTHKHTA